MGKKSRKSKPKNKRKGDSTSPSTAAISPTAAVGEPSSSSPDAGMVLSVTCPSRTPVYGAPPAPPPGAVCWICLDGDPDEGGKPIVRDCSCRGDDAGFAHLSCLAGYARTKSKEIIDKGDKVRSLINQWQKCPTCCQNYQRRVGIDMSKYYISFVEENYPSPKMRMQFWKLYGFQHILEIISNMKLFATNFELSAELREEGVQAAKQMISEIEGMDEVTNERHQRCIEAKKIFAFNNLGNLVEDGTREGYVLTLACLDKVRDCLISQGQDVTEISATIKLTEAGRDGCFDFSHHNMEAMLEAGRNRYEKITREHGEDAAYAEERVELGIMFARMTLQLKGHGLESGRLINDLGIVSRRVLGPDHPLTEEVQSYLEDSRQRMVKVMTSSGMTECDALGFNVDTGTYSVAGDLPVRGIYQLGIDMFEMVPGTPVVCHGLENTQHLNGKIGEVMSYDAAICRYKVRFENTCLKPASIKGANLRILFDLPDNN